jgi:hypothetical protein
MKLAAIPVAHTQYAVEFTKTKPVADGEECIGYCDTDKKRLVIWRNPNATAMRSCLIHEWLHAVFYEIGQVELSEDHSVICPLEMALMRLRLEVPSL